KPVRPVLPPEQAATGDAGAGGGGGGDFVGVPVTGGGRAADAGDFRRALQPGSDRGGNCGRHRISGADLDSGGCVSLPPDRGTGCAAHLHHAGARAADGRTGGGSGTFFHLDGQAVEDSFAGIVAAVVAGDGGGSHGGDHRDLVSAGAFGGVFDHPAGGGGRDWL